MKIAFLKDKIVKTVTAFSLLLFSVVPVSAQEASSGTLSMNPASVTFSSVGQSRTIDIVYTGDNITAAALYFNVGPGVRINSFTPGDGLVFIVDDPENGEVHVGRLEDGDVVSGSTLVTMEVVATQCGSIGSISFNETETLIPNTDLAFNNAGYSVNCSTTGGTVTPPPPIGGTGTPTRTPSVLPRTATSSDIIFFSLPLIAIATGLLLVAIKNKKSSEDVKIIVKDRNY